jgi:PAS domain S-box-containing protein
MLPLVPDRALGTTRMILYAAARVLGCGSVQLTMVDEERKHLVFITSITNRELATLEAVEHALGFQLEGARMQLDNESSVVVRAMREGRVIVTHGVGELAGLAVDPEAVEAITRTIGPRSFGAVPIAGRSGALGVLIFEKPDDSGFTTEDRELLVAYADRVGADLESQALSDDVRRLETLGPAGARVPVIYSCDRELVVATEPGAGRPLWEALGVGEGLVRDALARAQAGAPATVSLRALGGKLVRLTIAHGPAQAVLAAAEDLEETELLRREAARVREHLAKVLRSIGDAILTLDAEGCVASGNEAVARALGYQPDELIGREALRLCADDRSRRRAGELRHQVRASGFAEGELRLRRKDGSTFTGAVSALALADDEERPAGMVWRIHDLTERQRGDAERKRLRARLLHSERLSALGEMAARIAHEVRNPLVSIGAAAQVVAEELPPESPVLGEASHRA